MKRTTPYGFFVFMILFIFTLSFIADCQSEELKLQKLTENLYVVFGDGANVAFLVTEEGVLVVDTPIYPYQSKIMIDKIHQITDRPIKYLVYTHYHADHTNGAQGFPESTIVIAHENTSKNMRNKSLPYRIIPYPSDIPELEQEVEKLRKEKSPKLKEVEKELQRARKQLKETQQLKLILPEKTFQKRLDIEMSGKKVILLYMGNGHTDCDVLVYFPSEKAIHMGDLLFHNMIPSIIHEAGGNTENWITILEKVAAMDVEIVIPGHGEIADKQGLLFQAEFFKDLRAEVKKYVDKEASLEQTKEMLKLPKYENTRGYDKNLAENITVAYHEMTNKNK